MEKKMLMCRICLVENVSMFVVVNSDLHKLYEKLTDIPFETKDRPILACFFCCAKLKQCYRLLQKCLEAEELFAQMKNEDYEPNPLINQDHLEFYGGFIKSPTENISIFDACQTESIAMKEELPGVCEGLDDIIEPKEEHQSDENLDNSCLDEADIPPHHPKSDLDYDVPLIEFKTEVEEEQEVSKKKRTARETKKLEPENLDNSYLDVADIPPHHPESDLDYDVPLTEFKTEVEEEQEVSKKKQRARETKRATVAKKSKLDTRRTKLEDAITAEQTEKSDSTDIGTIQKLTSESDTYFKEHYKCDQRSNKRVKKKMLHTRIGERPYKCDVCQLSFSVKSDLSQHKRIHTGEKPYKCDVCQLSCKRKGDLTRHIRIHTNDKPYKCGVCQRSFSRKNCLTKHIRIHTGEKPYKCDVCQHSFSEMGSLTKHIRLHTGEKPYGCDVCQRSFSAKCNLTRHIRTHNDEKPYKCNVGTNVSLVLLKRVV